MRYVFCAGMYRACSTWQYDVVCHLVEKRSNGIRLGFLEGERLPESLGGKPLSLVGALKTPRRARCVRGSAGLEPSDRGLRPPTTRATWPSRGCTSRGSASRRRSSSEVSSSWCSTNDEFWRGRPRVLLPAVQSPRGRPCSPAFWSSAVTWLQPDVRGEADGDCRREFLVRQPRADRGAETQGPRGRSRPGRPFAHLHARPGHAPALEPFEGPTLKFRRAG